MLRLQAKEIRQVELRSCKVGQPIDRVSASHCSGSVSCTNFPSAAGRQPGEGEGN
jgi:hypothetical protein